MEFTKAELAGTLLQLRQANGYELIGRWSICSFELGDMTSEMDIMRAFATELDLYYLGNPNIASVHIHGEKVSIIYFLIPTEHVNEIGRLVFSFRITQE